MTAPLRFRFAATAIATSAAALVAMLLLVRPGLRERATDEVRERLLAEARRMGRVREGPLARGAGPEPVDRLVDAAARDVRARVTIIAPDGRVLGESTLSGEALLRMENHGARPEVADALLRGEGQSIRHS